MVLPTEAIVIIAAILAVMVRTFIPFLRKAKEAEEAGKPITFANKYWGTFGLALVGSAVSGIVLFPSLLAQIPEGASALVIFASIFGIAYTSNDVLNEVVAT